VKETRGEGEWEEHLDEELRRASHQFNFTGNTLDNGRVRTDVTERITGKTCSLCCEMEKFSKYRVKKNGAGEAWATALGSARKLKKGGKRKEEIGTGQT